MEGCEMTTIDTHPGPAFEHPWAVRFCHWSNAVAMTILTLSGLRIFSAFPSFGSKIPQHDLIEAVPQAVTLGGGSAAPCNGISRSCGSSASEAHCM